jgi:quinol monooxygenase YgiN
MTKLALYVQLEAKPGKEREVEDFLKGASPGMGEGRTECHFVEEEPGTKTRFAMKMRPTTFGIFDAFSNEGDRDAHLSGAVARALMAKVPDLFATPPGIHKIDILADKLPDRGERA